MEKDKAGIARRQSPFTAFLATAKEVGKSAIGRQPCITYGPNNSGFDQAQAEIYNNQLDQDEKEQITADVEKKITWQKQRQDRQKEYNLLAPEEKEILKSGEFQNRRGYYKFLKSKKLEKLQSDIAYLQRQVQEPWGIIDITISDQYEKMPHEFQLLITKIHPRLKEMISFWERFVIFREKSDNQLDRIYEYVMTRMEIQCEICDSPQESNQNFIKHVKQCHSELIDGGEYNAMQPKTRANFVWMHQLMFKQDVCALGCGWKKKTNEQSKHHLGDATSDTISQMRIHMILYHSTHQLKQWGVSRNYLKYQEKMITRDQMRKLISPEVLKLNKNSKRLDRLLNGENDEQIDQPKAQVQNNIEQSQAYDYGQSTSQAQNFNTDQSQTQNSYNYESKMFR